MPYPVGLCAPSLEAPGRVEPSNTSNRHLLLPNDDPAASAEACVRPGRLPIINLFRKPTGQSIPECKLMLMICSFNLE